MTQIDENRDQQFGIPQQPQWSPQGQYQGLYATGFAAAMGLGPLVVTSTAVRGPWGWALLGLLLAVTGVVTVPVAAWAAARQAEDRRAAAGT